MIIEWSDDPERDASRYAADLEEEGARRPRCCECDSPIWDDEYYQIDGQAYCKECMDGHIRYVCCEDY